MATTAAAVLDDITMGKGLGNLLPSPRNGGEKKKS